MAGLGIPIAPSLPHLDAGPLAAHILIVDDSPDNRRAFSGCLLQAGAIVELACDGQEACRRIWEAEADGRPFDLVIMDMQMPVLDGYEATANLRAHGYARPILGLTADPYPGQQGRCLAAGCTEYAAKPIDPARFLALVADLIG